MDQIDELSKKIERSALDSLHSSCPSDATRAIGLEWVEVDDGVIALSTGDPSILIDRALGLGSTEPISAESIEAVRAT